MKEKWIAIIGSPRKGENTDLLVGYIIEALNTVNIDVEKFVLESRNINTCNGCEYCIKTGMCIINDSVSTIIEKMKTANGFILASPSYNYDMTAQMKALLDRTFFLNDYKDGWSSRLSNGKKAILVGVCKGRNEEYLGNTINGMAKSIEELGVSIVEVIKYYNTKDVRVIENDKIKEVIFDKIISNRHIKNS